MISAINSAIGGFNAATTQINVNANNIANAESTTTFENGVQVNTPYVPQQVVQSSQQNGGVVANVVPVNPSSVELNDPGNAAASVDGLTSYPNVDQSQQLIQANIASYDAQANLSVIKVQDNLFQSVLNIIS